jgi:hypothetical protein
MALKKIGYYISKGRCVKAYSLKKKNRSGRLVNKKVNSRRKVLGKKTKVYKRKSSCMKVLKSKRKSSRKKSVKRRRKRSSPKRRRSSPKRRRSSPKRRRSRFGNIKAGVPKLSTPLTLQLGQTYDYQKNHYSNTPTSFLSYNFPKNFNWTTGSMGKSSLPSYKNINSFGQYFH